MSEAEQSTQFDISTVIEDAKQIITDPVNFYRNMPTGGGFSNPVIFVAAVGAVTGLLMVVMAMVGFGPASAGVAGLMAVVIFPIFAVIGSFIGGAIMFVIWKLMGSEKEFETAYRCVTYAYALAPIMVLVSLVPYLGVLVKVLWGTFLMYTASIEVHQLKAETAKIVFAVLAVLGLLLNFSF